MFFDLTLLGCVLTLLHITLYFFLGYRRLEHVANAFAGLTLLMVLLQYRMLYKVLPVQPFASLTGIMLLLTVAMIIGYFILYFRYGRPSIGLFVFPLTIIFVMISRFTSGMAVSSEGVAVTFWLYIHLPFTILGTAFFMLSTFTGIMYFIQERQLKRKNFGIIFRRFPPLDTINRLNNTTLYIGFYTFTIGLLAGLVWMFYSSGRINIFSPKLVFAIITWIIYSSITFYKQIRGMSPKDTALSTIIGFISVLITYVGVAYFVMG